VTQAPRQAFTISRRRIHDSDLTIDPFNFEEDEEVTGLTAHCGPSTLAPTKSPPALLPLSQSIYLLTAPLAPALASEPPDPDLQIACRFLSTPPVQTEFILATLV
jgi:hypothetical protein